MDPTIFCRKTLISRWKNEIEFISRRSVTLTALTTSLTQPWKIFFTFLFQKKLLLSRHVLKFILKFGTKQNTASCSSRATTKTRLTSWAIFDLEKHVLRIWHFDLHYSPLSLLFVKFISDFLHIPIFFFSSLERFSIALLLLSSIFISVFSHAVTYAAASNITRSDSEQGINQTRLNAHLALSHPRANTHSLQEVEYSHTLSSLCASFCRQLAPRFLPTQTARRRTQFPSRTFYVIYKKLLTLHGLPDELLRLRHFRVLS